MNGKLTRHSPKVLTVIICLATLSMGFLCLPSNVTPTSPAPNQPVQPVQPVQPIVTDEPVVEPPVVDTSGLDPSGPWLLIESDEGLWATNADGSGLTQLTDIEYWSSLGAAVQPRGTQVVFISPPSFPYDLHKMTLNLLSLPDGRVTKITDLTSPETEGYADLAPGDAGLEALRAIREQSNYAWSPDGTRLAFVGLMDGPSAEVYLYDSISGDIQRVSNDDSQNYWPSWSPDGNTLLYFGAESFGVGAGFDTNGVWSARGDGTHATLLFNPPGGSMKLVGWLDPITAVFKTWTPGGGDEKLRLFDVTTLQSVMLSNGSIISAAVDSVSGAAMFADSSGLYLLTAEDRSPVRVSQEEVTWIGRVEPGEYYFSVGFTNGNLATYGTGDLDNQVSPFNGTGGSLNVAMYGWIWAWTSEGGSQSGVWITGPGIETGQIFDGSARLPIWDMHNNLLFFAQEGGDGYDILRTTFDGYFQDLEVVNFIDATVSAVAWLAGQ
jgi:hypothetical protein